MNAKVMRRGIALAAAVGIVAAPSALAGGWHSGGSHEHGGHVARQSSHSGHHGWRDGGGSWSRHRAGSWSRGSGKSRGGCTRHDPPPVDPPPVDPPPVDPPPEL